MKLLYWWDKIEIKWHKNDIYQGNYIRGIYEARLDDTIQDMRQN